MIDPIVEVVDPTTRKVLKTISPKEFGFDTDPQAYQKHIEQLAREWARGTDTSNGYDQRMMLDRLDENGQVIKGSRKSF